MASISGSTPTALTETHTDYRYPYRNFVIGIPKKFLSILEKLQKNQEYAIDLDAVYSVSTCTSDQLLGWPFDNQRLACVHLNIPPADREKLPYDPVSYVESNGLVVAGWFAVPNHQYCRMPLSPINRRLYNLECFSLKTYSYQFPLRGNVDLSRPLRNLPTHRQTQGDNSKNTTVASVMAITPASPATATAVTYHTSTGSSDVRIDEASELTMASASASALLSPASATTLGTKRKASVTNQQPTRTVSEDGSIAIPYRPKRQRAESGPGAHPVPASKQLESAKTMQNNGINKLSAFLWASITRIGRLALQGMVLTWMMELEPCFESSDVQAWWPPHICKTSLNNLREEGKHLHTAGFPSPLTLIRSYICSCTYSAVLSRTSS
jgi:hypothetical protein